jgi:hypothetical protein
MLIGHYGISIIAKNTDAISGYRVTALAVLAVQVEAGFALDSPGSKQAFRIGNKYILLTR